MTYIANREFYFDVAKGISKGNVADTRFGYNPSVSTSYQDIWEIGGLFTYQLIPENIGVASTSVNDILLGTGARTVEVSGRDEAYNKISEIINMNGRTPVYTAQKFLRVCRLSVLSTGSNQYNIGSIYAGTGTFSGGIPANKYNIVTPNNNGSLSLCYTVPSGKDAIFLSLAAGSNSIKEITVALFVREFNSVFQLKNKFVISQATNNMMFDVPLKVPEKSDITLRAKTSSGVAEVSASWNLILTDK